MQTPWLRESQLDDDIFEEKMLFIMTFDKERERSMSYNILPGANERWESVEKDWLVVGNLSGGTDDFSGCLDVCLSSGLLEWLRCWLRGNSWLEESLGKLDRVVVNILAINEIIHVGQCIIEVLAGNLPDSHVLSTDGILTDLLQVTVDQTEVVGVDANGFDFWVQLQFIHGKGSLNSVGEL
ncbi:hypothetical protein GCK72_023672 [Caenorhabditis remanei]|uniref:Uncharacterized protein n=1 Tax=Caenorhabditis remanei TaxID=31234 RepID=A0A6A5FWZ3_CAERE|nr:hypothetical protein GCK72_023672 [Caenorhabditis remanei]KAF1747210.1 hypothetical protein GCK72_023672 [Caenorhabditis remanei]